MLQSTLFLEYRNTRRSPNKQAAQYFRTHEKRCVSNQRPRSFLVVNRGYTHQAQVLHALPPWLPCSYLHVKIVLVFDKSLATVVDLVPNTQLLYFGYGFSPSGINTHLPAVLVDIDRGITVDRVSDNIVQTHGLIKYPLKEIGIPNVISVTTAATAVLVSSYCSSCCAR